MQRRSRAQNDRRLGIGSALLAAPRPRDLSGVARGEDTASSDVDILVDLADDVGVVGLERELSEILSRPVDVVPAAGLKPAVAKRVADEAIAP